MGILLLCILAKDQLRLLGGLFCLSVTVAHQPNFTHWGQSLVLNRIWTHTYYWSACSGLGLGGSLRHWQFLTQHSCLQLLTWGVSWGEVQSCTSGSCLGQDSRCSRDFTLLHYRGLRFPAVLPSMQPDLSLK